MSEIVSEIATNVITRERVGRLDSVRGWRREVGKIYRAMRRGEIRTADATRMAYVCDIGHRLVALEERLRELHKFNRGEGAAALVQSTDFASLLEKFPASDRSTG